MERLVGPDVIAEAKELLRAGLRDVQDLYSTQLTFRRRDPATGWQDFVTVNAISVKLDNAMAREAMGSVETTTLGTANVWTEDVAGANEVIPGDRFTWDGHVCVVTLVQPTKLDTYVAVRFKLVEGN